MPGYFERLVLIALAAASQPIAAGADPQPPFSDLAIGSLIRPAESGRWALTAGSGGYVIACNDRDCARHPIFAQITPDAGAQCGETILAEHALLGHPGAFGDPEFMTIARPGFTITAVLIDMGCRNWTGSPVHACTAVSGDLYMFAADGGGCRGTPPRFHEPVLQFLEGLALAQP